MEDLVHGGAAGAFTHYALSTAGTASWGKAEQGDHKKAQQAHSAEAAEGPGPVNGASSCSVHTVTVRESCRM